MRNGQQKGNFQNKQRVIPFCNNGNLALDFWQNIYF